MTARVPVATALIALGACAPAMAPAGAPAPSGAHVVYVASESADQVTRLRFDGTGFQVERRRHVGIMPTEIDGPHGLAIAPDGRHYYVTLGHGTPYGSLWKISTETDELIERTMLGHFPATVDVTPDGRYAFVSNFNLHGDHVPSSISKVYLPNMAEVARTETCVMPHGSRINRQGTRQYSACMMDELLVEIDVATGSVARRFSVAKGREGPVRHAPAMHGEHAGHAMPGAGGAHGAEMAQECSPTWAHPSPDGRTVFVACNRSGEVLEIDAEGWTLRRRIPTGEGPYNLDVTPDGRLLVVTLKNRTAPATEVIDLASGRSLARVPNSTTLPHGIALTPDSRWAFVSVEGIGSEPGRVDAIDLVSLRRVATAEVGQQATGIASMPAR